MPSSGADRWSVWFDLDPRPGPLNMAIDQALLERAGRHGERWLRLYRWSPHCLSFGRHERAARRYDRERIAATGLDLVRRPTGGRAVWHAAELTYAIALPAASLAGIRSTYLEIHRMLLAALRSLEVDATLAEDMPVPSLDAGACFARPVGGEIMVAGRKVVGSAQVREAGGLLQHGSILLGDDQSMVAAVSRGDPPRDGSAPLERLTGRPFPPAAMARAIAATAAAQWPGIWHEAANVAAALAGAERHLPRFASEDWTWRA